MKTFNHLGSCLIAILLQAAFWAPGTAAFAQAAYPNRAVLIVVPGATGTGFDSLARLLAPGLSERLGRPVVVENRAGAGSLIGNEYVVKAPPDGHTLLMAASGLTIQPALIKKMPYDVERDFAPVTLVVSVPNMILVNASSPAKSIGELIALAKARPGELQFASAGLGSNSHLTMQLFVSVAQVSVLHVPYKGATPGLTDLLGGHVAMMSMPVADAMPHVRAGKLRALAVTSLTRVPAAPAVPTVAESGFPGFESLNWFGLLAPSKTPPDIVARLQAETAAVMREPAVRDKLAADNVLPVANTPAEFAVFVKEQIAKWAEVAKKANITPE